VFVEGARVDETRLDRPQSSFVARGEAVISMPNYRPKRTKMYRRMNYGAVPGFSPICMDASDPYTLRCGYEKRLLRELPLPRAGVLSLLSWFVSRFLRKYVKKTRPMETEDWLATTGYNENRKAQLRESATELRGGVPNHHARMSINGFGKHESYPELKHERTINSRCDLVKVWAGPMIKAVENVVYELPWFIKHVPVPDRPPMIKALERAGRKYYISDYTAFESHMTPEVMRAVECQLYEWCLSSTPGIKLFCNMLCGLNKIHTRHGMRVELQGRRMSGEMCTSVGNGFTNLMIVLFVCWLRNVSAEGFVEGDDGVFACDGEIFEADFKAVGFTIKLESLKSPCEGSFCGLVFAANSEIIRNPVKFVAGFAWTHSYVHAGQRIMDELLHSKCLSALFETPQCPIVSVLARYALPHVAYTEPRPEYDDPYHKSMLPPRDYKIPPFCPHEETRKLFFEQYGVSISAQLEIEAMISRGDLASVRRLLCPPADHVFFTNRYVVVT